MGYEIKVEVEPINGTYSDLREIEKFLKKQHPKYGIDLFYTNQCKMSILGDFCDASKLIPDIFIKVKCRGENFGDECIFYIKNSKYKWVYPKWDKITENDLE